jgi:hypothetical protein
VEVLGAADAAACVLHEEILASIGSLVISEVSPGGWCPRPQAGTRLVQAVVRLGAMGSVVRVAHWLELHMELVVRCRPAVFTALAVEDRLAAGRAEDWGLELDRLADALLVPDSVSGQPLLVASPCTPRATCSPGRWWPPPYDYQKVQIVITRILKFDSLTYFLL